MCESIVFLWNHSFAFHACVSGNVKNGVAVDASPRFLHDLGDFE